MNIPEIPDGPPYRYGRDFTVGFRRGSADVLRGMGFLPSPGPVRAWFNGVPHDFTPGTVQEPTDWGRVEGMDQEGDMSN